MKKTYIFPTTEAHEAACTQIIAFSANGGGKATDDPTIGDGSDYGSDENRVKDFWDFHWNE